MNDPTFHRMFGMFRASNRELQNRLFDHIRQTPVPTPRPEPKVAINKPNEFTSTDAKKLHSFLFACELNFSSKEDIQSHQIYVHVGYSVYIL